MNDDARRIIDQLAYLSINVDHLTRPGGLLDELEALLPEQVTNGPAGSTTHQKVSGSPAPWNAAAASVLFDITEGARRLEASLRRAVSGSPGLRRGDSDANTRQALRSCVRLAEGLDNPDEVTEVTRIVARWVTAARQLPDIDQADKWEPLPRQPKMLPPNCEYCGLFTLRWNRRTGEVRCFTDECRDGDGYRPVARMEVGRYSGTASLIWRDGRSVTYNHQAAA